MRRGQATSRSDLPISWLKGRALPVIGFPRSPRCHAVFVLVGLLVTGSTVHASSLINNGGFESTGANTQSYEIEPGNPLPGWTLTQPNSGDIACVVVGGVNNMCGSGYMGPPGNTPATFAVFPRVSPVGGNFLAGDSDILYSETISQTITGLTAGAKYLLTFYQAGAQQSGYNGATYDQWRDLRSVEGHVWRIEPNVDDDERAERGRGRLDDAIDDLHGGVHEPGAHVPRGGRADR